LRRRPRRASRFPRTRALYERAYETLYVALINLVEMLHLPLVEYLGGYRAAGLAVDYSPIFGASYAIAALLLTCFWTARGAFGPCRARCDLAVLLLRAALFAGCITWQRATWRAAARSPHLAHAGGAARSVARQRALQRRAPAPPLRRAPATRAPRQAGVSSPRSCAQHAALLFCPSAVLSSARA
jgi:hypothetical protein